MPYRAWACMHVHVFAGASTRVKLSRAAGYSTNHPPKKCPPTLRHFRWSVPFVSLRASCDSSEMPSQAVNKEILHGLPVAPRHEITAGALLPENLCCRSKTQEVEVNIGPCCVSQVAGEVSEQSAAKRISGCIYVTASSPPKVKFSVPWFGLSLCISLPFLVSGEFCRGFELGLPNRFDMIGSFARSAFPQ